MCVPDGALQRGLAHQRRYRARPDHSRFGKKVRDIVYPEAELRFDTSKPDGTPRKVLDVTRLRELGWTAKIELGAGIESTYRWFLENQNVASDSSREKAEASAS